MTVKETMKDNDTTSSAGKLAEELAARFLEKRGLPVVARNFRCRGGEIDLVCRDGKVLVFVECKCFPFTKFMRIYRTRVI